MIHIRVHRDQQANPDEAFVAMFERMLKAFDFADERPYASRVKSGLQCRPGLRQAARDRMVQLQGSGTWGSSLSTDGFAAIRGER